MWHLAWLPSFPGPSMTLPCSAGLMYGPWLPRCLAGGEHGLKYQCPSYTSRVSPIAPSSGLAQVNSSKEQNINEMKLNKFICVCPSLRECSELNLNLAIEIDRSSIRFRNDTNNNAECLGWAGSVGQQVQQVWRGD
ncbi:hypothetical protein E2C01_073474 [Portunus trituberculatus]|uniref:Uncharacterized protein n=1 Tax=Portunus trituberculatus TaxID=210409 RepID=A0A5B7I9T8_PORTR|nr:hypothetical protein [Portunus trituberculatus]